MSKTPIIFRLLQIVGMIFLALTIAMTLLGGAGTTCAAFLAENWESMAPLVPVKPVLQILVFVSLAAGIAGTMAAVRLAKARKKAYYQVLLFLIIAGVASAIQFYFSATFRGKTAPNNVRLYLTIITFLYFLLLRLPGIWEKLPFNRSSSSKAGTIGSGLALFLSGLVTLTTTIWAAPTHTFDGINTSNELLILLLIVGAALILLGAALLGMISLELKSKPQVDLPST